MTRFITLTDATRRLLDRESCPLLVQVEQICFVQRWRFPGPSEAAEVGGLTMSGPATEGACITLISEAKLYVLETVEQISALCTSNLPQLQAYTDADLARRKAVMSLVPLFKILPWRDSVFQAVTHSTQLWHVWRVDGTIAEPSCALAALDEWHAWALSQGPDSPFREVGYAPARNASPRR